MKKRTTGIPLRATRGGGRSPGSRGRVELLRTARATKPRGALRFVTGTSRVSIAFLPPPRVKKLSAAAARHDPPQSN